MRIIFALYNLHSISCISNAQFQSHQIFAIQRIIKGSTINITQANYQAPFQAPFKHQIPKDDLKSDNAEFTLKDPSWIHLSIDKGKLPQESISDIVNRFVENKKNNIQPTNLEELIEVTIDMGKMSAYFFAVIRNPRANHEQLKELEKGFEAIPDFYRDPDICINNADQLPYDPAYSNPYATKADFNSGVQKINDMLDQVLKQEYEKDPNSIDVKRLLRIKGELATVSEHMELLKQSIHDDVQSFIGGLPNESVQEMAQTYNEYSYLRTQNSSFEGYMFIQFMHSMGSVMSTYHGAAKQIAQFVSEDVKQELQKAISDINWYYVREWNNNFPLIQM